MIDRYARRNDASNYYNILEIMVLRLIGQYYDFLVYVGLFDRESQTYNTGKIFWYIVAAIIGLVVFAPFYIASIMYIVKSLI